MAGLPKVTRDTDHQDHDSTDRESLPAGPKRWQENVDGIPQWGAVAMGHAVVHSYVPGLGLASHARLS